MRYHALLLGNSTFPADQNNLPPVEGPVNDLVVLRAALTDPDVGLFDNERVRLLPERTMAEILVEIETFFAEARASDHLLLYYSGRSVLDAQGRLFLCGRDTRLELLRSTAVDVATIGSMIDASAAAMTVIVLDCCQSGPSPDSLDPTSLSGPRRTVLACGRSSDQATQTDGLHGTSIFTQHLVDGLLGAAADRDGDGLVDVEDVFAYAYGRLAEGRQLPHRRYSESGVGVLGRRSGASPRPAPGSPPPAGSAAPGVATPTPDVHPIRPEALPPPPAAAQHGAASPAAAAAAPPRHRDEAGTGVGGAWGPVPDDHDRHRPHPVPVAPSRPGWSRWPLLLLVPVALLAAGATAVTLTRSGDGSAPAGTPRTVDPVAAVAALAGPWSWDRTLTSSSIPGYFVGNLDHRQLDLSTSCTGGPCRLVASYRPSSSNQIVTADVAYDGREYHTTLSVPRLCHGAAAGQYTVQLDFRSEAAGGGPPRALVGTWAEEYQDAPPCIRTSTTFSVRASPGHGVPNAFPTEDEQTALYYARVPYKQCVRDAVRPPGAKASVACQPGPAGVATMAVTTFVDKPSLDAAYAARLGAARQQPGGRGEVVSPGGTSRLTTFVDAAGRAEIIESFHAGSVFVLSDWVGPNADTESLSQARRTSCQC